MKSFTICVIVSGCPGWFSISDVHTATWIVKDGEPQAEIVIATNPARAAEFGAAELQAYIKKITGARLEIVSTPTNKKPVKIYVGDSEAARHAGVTSDGLNTGTNADRSVVLERLRHA